MSGSRPHFQGSISQLEQLVEQHRLDRQRLEIIAAELRHRDTDRAHRLRAKITSILDGLELQLLLQPEPSGALQVTSAPSFDVLPTDNPRRNEFNELRAKLEIEPEHDDRAQVIPIVEEFAPSSEGSEPAVKIDRSSMSDIPSQTVDAADPLVLSRMLDLIDYVIAVEKDKLKLVTDVADHRALHRAHDELAELPGIAFNRLSGEDVAFLTVERLNRKPPNN